MFAELLANRQEIKKMREARKTKEKEILAYDLESNDVEIAKNGTALILVLLGLISSGIVAIFYDIALGIVLGICTLILMFGAILIESIIRTISEIALDFYNEVFSANVNTRRNYKESRKIINYAIKNDKITNDHISLILESLNSCAKLETEVNMEARRINLSKVIEDSSSINTSISNTISNTNKPSVNTTNNTEVKEVKEEKKGSRYKLKFGDDNITLLYNDGSESDKVSYDEIIMPETEDQIKAMPYPTIYGYIEKEDRIIYIDMEQEIALVANK